MPSSNVQGASSLYGRLVSTRPQGASKFRSMRSDLAAFGAADLYEYARPEGAQNPRIASSEDLIARAEQLVKQWTRNTSERSAAERLCSRAREVFGEDAERRRYDEYLQWCDLRAVFDDLEARMDPATSSCTDVEVASELARLRELLGSRSQAEALMESYLANRGVEFVDSHDAQVSTAQGRAQVREELASANLLPDSAFQPATQAPPTQPMVAQSAPPVQQQQYQGAAYDPSGQVSVIRRCVCGSLNPADNTYCQTCGRPLEGTTTIPPIARGYAAAPSVEAPPVRAPQPGRRTFPVAAVIVAIVVILAIGGGLAFYFMGGASSLFGSASSESSSSADKNSKRIQSGYVEPVTCSSSTVITAYDVDEEPLAAYTVELKNRKGGLTVDGSLLVERSGGGDASFVIAQFNRDDGKTVEDVPDGEYDVIMKSVDGKSECTFVMSYRASDKDAVKAVDVIATK